MSIVKPALDLSAIGSEFADDTTAFVMLELPDSTQWIGRTDFDAARVEMVSCEIPKRVLCCDKVTVFVISKLDHVSCGVGARSNFAFGSVANGFGHGAIWTNGLDHAVLLIVLVSGDVAQCISGDDGVAFGIKLGAGDMTEGISAAAELNAGMDAGTVQSVAMGGFAPEGIDFRHEETALIILSLIQGHGLFGTCGLSLHSGEFSFCRSRGDFGPGGDSAIRCREERPVVRFVFVMDFGFTTWADSGHHGIRACLRGDGVGPNAIAEKVVAGLIPCQQRGDGITPGDGDLRVAVLARGVVTGDGGGVRKVDGFQLLARMVVKLPNFDSVKRSDGQRGDAATFGVARNLVGRGLAFAIGEFRQ